MNRWTPPFFHLCICPHGINKPAGASPDSQDSRRWTIVCGRAGPPGVPPTRRRSLGSPAHAEAGPAARGNRRARRRELAAPGTDRVPVGKASPALASASPRFPGRTWGARGSRWGPAARTRDSSLEARVRASGPRPGPERPPPSQVRSRLPGPSAPSGAAGRELPSRLRPRSVPRAGPSPGRPPPPREPLPRGPGPFPRVAPSHAAHSPRRPAPGSPGSPGSLP